MCIGEKDGCVLISCRIMPNARKDGLEGLRADHLLVRLASPPVDGKANKNLIRFVAEVLAVSKSRVRIIQGEKSRTKVLEIEGLTAEDARQRLGLTQ